MDIWSDDFEIGEMMLDGIRYTLTKEETKILGFTDESGQERDAEITHRINGFEIPLYVVIYDDGQTFSFVHEAVPGIGMFQGLADEEIFDQATEILCSIAD